MLHLIKMWLTVLVEEQTPQGKRTRTGSGSRGTPQGGVISPLLANIYMRRFLKAWEQRGYDQSLSTRIVNYADDFVILCRGTAHQALSEARAILTRIGLTLNEAKTRTCAAWQESFNFLGYTFGKFYYAVKGTTYLGAEPSAKSLAKLRDRIRELTERSTTKQSTAELIGRVNCVLRGWAGYFGYGTLSAAYRAVDAHVEDRVRHWLVRKHKRDGRGTREYPEEWLYSQGLLCLSRQLAAFRKSRV